MTVVDVQKDLGTRSLTIVTDHHATPERLWRLWADPRQLEGWWGPPDYPSTVTDHDLTSGGVVRYYMTGPDGERSHGGWRVLSAEPPTRLEMKDFFADADGNENTDLPSSTMVITIAGAGEGTSRMTVATTWESAEAMQAVLDMGLEEGIRQSLAQLEALLAAD